MNKTNHRFQLAFCGKDLVAIAKHFLARGEPFDGVPGWVDVDARERKPSDDWLAKWSSKAKIKLWAEWHGDTDRRSLISLNPNRSCILTWPPKPRFSEKQVLELVRPVPFSYGSTSGLYKAWFNTNKWEHHIIGPSLPSLGWACYFKPPGLARFPSRWFEHGPWLTLKGAGDVTLTTFHDLAADAETALAQAVPCHEWMWWGFAQEDYGDFECDLSGRYDAKSRTHEIVVGEREFTELDPFEASIARFEQRFPHGKPVKHVSFVFQSSKQAEKHLHRLWLYEMQCWTETGAVRGSGSTSSTA